MRKKVRQLIYIFIAFAFSLVVIYISVSYHYFSYKTEATLMQNAYTKLLERETFFQEYLQHAKRFIHALRDSNGFKNYLLDKNLSKEVISAFEMVARSEIELMQVRYLDKEGMERIRIERTKELKEPLLIPSSQLQDKSERYYFYESKKKELERVWFSAIDLNKEHGEVEVPYRPTMRLMLPIANEAGEFDGVLVLNYCIKEFLTHLLDSLFYDFVLLNSYGEILKHFDETKSWGSYQTPKNCVIKEFPKHYNKILNAHYKGASMVAKKLDVPLHKGAHLVVQVKRSYIAQMQADMRDKYIVVSLMIVVTSILLSILIVYQFSNTLFSMQEIKEMNERLNHQKEELEHILKAIVEGIVILDKRGRFLDCNTIFLQMSGFEREKLKDKTFAQMFPKNIRYYVATAQRNSTIFS